MRQKKSKCINKQVIDLVEEIRRHAANLYSAAEELLEKAGDDPDIETLHLACEVADAEVNTWLRNTEIGLRIDKASTRRELAGMKADGKSKKAATRTVAFEILPVFTLEGAWMNGLEQLCIIGEFDNGKPDGNVVFRLADPGPSLHLMRQAVKTGEVLRAG